MKKLLINYSFRMGKYPSYYGEWCIGVFFRKLNISPDTYVFEFVVGRYYFGLVKKYIKGV